MTIRQPAVLPYAAAPPPAAAGGRIAGYDFARALAILGMVLVHFSLVMGSDQTHPRWLAEIIELLDGRAAATFVVLAGVGISLRWSRRQAAAEPDAKPDAGRRLWRSL